MINLQEDQVSHLLCSLNQRLLFQVLREVQEEEKDQKESKIVIKAILLIDRQNHPRIKFLRKPTRVR